MRVVVIGAGIGGLATAAGLQRAGAEVTVLERAAGLRTGGAALSLFANGWRALAALGLGHELHEAAGPARTDLQAGQRRPDGRWLSRTPAAAVAGLRVVERSALLGALQDALLPGALCLGTAAEDVSDDGREVQVRDPGGGRRVLHADVVVAADGVHSRVRAGWPGDPGVRQAAYASWRGITARPVDLRGAAGETWGDGLRMGLAPLADGRVYWFAVVSTTGTGRPVATGTSADDPALLPSLFAGWHAPVAEVLAATPVEDVVPLLPIVDLAGPLPSFRRGRCVLLGDAAHAMTPDLGQGGNQALEDAATVVRLLHPQAAAAEVDPAAVEQALTAYDRVRRPRTQRIARRARSVGATAHLRGTVRVRLRDTLVRLVPPAVMGAQLHAVQAWEPPAPGGPVGPSARSQA